jgi:hypothetical protein
MTLRNVRYVRVKDLEKSQKSDLGIEGDSGMVAIETHNPVFRQEATVVRAGIVDYILQG